MCDGPVVYTRRTPRARKEHKCCECHGRILTGEIYESFSGLWDSWGTHKTCSDCKAFRDSYCSATPSTEGWPPFGELHSYVEEEGDILLNSESIAIKRKRGRLLPIQGSAHVYTDAARYRWEDGEGNLHFGNGAKCVVTDEHGQLLAVDVERDITDSSVGEAYAHLLAVYHAVTEGLAEVVIHTDNMGVTSPAADPTNPRVAYLTTRDFLIQRHGLKVEFRFIRGAENPADAASRRPGMR